ncbi:MAG: NAD(P)-dependent oxidoreductase [Hyphomicrobiales bacterium]
MRYGYIGLGHLGGHLAANLLKAGFPVTVNDIDPKLGERHEELGGVFVDSPRKVGEAADCVITCLPSPKVSKLVITEVLKGMKPGGTWIENSTISRDDVMELSALAAEHGVKMLEAPVTGGVHRAAHGDITVLIGGDAALFEQHRAALEAMGGEIHYMGPLGSAAVIKVITNMLAFIHLVAAGEALMLAKRGGLDLAKAFHAIKASSGNSFVFETEGQLILNGSYDIAFTNDLAMKDLGFAMLFGREFGVPLDLAGQTYQTFLRATEKYGREAWSTQVVKLLEDDLGVDLRAPGFPAKLT